MAYDIIKEIENISDKMNNCVLDLLEKTTTEYGEKVAFEDDKRKVTYEELSRTAKGIATQLMEEMVGGEVVAFFFDKSVRAVCAIFGVIYAGVTYSFIDTKQPEKRITQILKILKPTIIITDLENRNNIISIAQAVGSKLKNIEDILEKSESINIDEIRINEKRLSIIDTQPLYINFTSGSTGSPKGVVVSHRSVMDFIPQFVEVMKITKDDKIGNQAPFDFDVSVKDIYSAIYTGATVVLIPREYFSKPVCLMDYLCDRKISILIWAVSALCFITTMKGLEYRCPTEIKCIGFSGEVMPIKHFNKLKKYLTKTKFINLYGPTEITCNCTYYSIPEEVTYSLQDTIPIGKNFVNEKVFLLDENDNLINPKNRSLIGEICVAGTCLALGYYNDEERTNKVFVQNPLQDKYREIIYRTGDMAQYVADGNLRYISRKDFQVKHLGHRIELGEIESITMQIDNVDRAICMYQLEKKRIVLFYTGKCEKKAIQEILHESLPTYMIPNKIIKLEMMPLNKNGKIDRNVIKELM